MRTEEQLEIRWGHQTQSSPRNCFDSLQPGSVHRAGASGLSPRLPPPGGGRLARGHRELPAPALAPLGPRSFDWDCSIARGDREFLASKEAPWTRHGSFPYSYRTPVTVGVLGTRGYGEVALSLVIYPKGKVGGVWPVQSGTDPHRSGFWKGPQRGES